MLALGACAAEDAPVVRTEFPASVAGSAVQVGRVETPEAAIGRVVSARFTANGENVVVLDYAPPYVKVFRRDGTLVASFLDKGGGPHEMRDPAALAVAGDSLILVADGSRRVAVFTTTGELRREGRTPYPVLAATSGCGEWLVYGPDFQSTGRPTWLHRLRFEAARARSEDLEFRDPVGGDVIGNGLPYGIARSGDTTHVWHVLGETPSILRWSCGDSRPDAKRVAPLASRETKQPKGESVRMSVHPGRRTLAGMAAVQGGVVVAAQVVPKPGQPKETELTLITPSGEFTVLVTGAYTLRDSHPLLGVLVSTADPIPRLFSVSESDLRAMFPRER